MTSSTERHRKIILIYIESNSVVTVVRKMQKLYPEAERLNRMQVHRILRRFKQTGSVLDQHYKNTKRPIQGVHEVK